MTTRTRFAIGLGLLLPVALALATTAVAAEALPDSPAGRELERWLEVVRGGDDEAAKAHYRERFTDEFRQAVPQARYMGVVRQVRVVTAGLEIERVEALSEHELSAFVRPGGVGWYELRIAVEQAPPHRIASLLANPGGAPSRRAKSPGAWSDLEDLLGDVREKRRLPAIAAAWVRGGEIVELAAVGVRESGTDRAVEPGDLFHVGSVTKSITATMIGSLVESGTLRWDLTLAEALPDLEMLDAYREVTLEQLLQHRAGVPEDKFFDRPEMERLSSLPGSTTEQRGAYVAEVLQREPIAAPGGEMHYSNAGYAIAGYVAERAAGSSWWALVRERVAVPLALESMRPGWPALADGPDQPRGHFADGASLRPQGVDEYPLGAFMAPAGDLSMTVADLARYAASHLAGLRGSDGALSAATVRRLHTPPPGGDYAMGWVVGSTPSGAPYHWHNGSAGTFYAMVALLPESDQAIVVVTNAARQGEAAATEVIRALAERGSGESPSPAER
jgi:CubicO group peptidase (beta-lactamase class C family)